MSRLKVILVVLVLAVFFIEAIWADAASTCSTWASNCSSCGDKANKLQTDTGTTAMRYECDELIIDAANNCGTRGPMMNPCPSWP